ncbi:MULTISPECIES: cysteine hydrolase family protein [unclassified Lysobacter]|uniref:cysteine hydrolase family protein n=1 Tax=unclassified Lysobacter TaxID=2635362 RepID=UPI0006F3273D|nr:MULTISPECIES: cysteine hydrolase family protein [unclassified Lysobacter]KRA76895.1 isochorismatase [Lysobacter sp. Root667]KRC38675.1 isochorismatase [Lysobacter sp. Root76]KRD71122.1 isochorismatase [Lysobacter sp. Root96]
MTRKRALIVVDVQNEYFSGGLLIEHPPVSQTLPNIGRAMDAARAAGVPVVVVQNTARPDAPVFVKGTPTWELNEVVASRPRDHYIEKNLPSVFTGTDLKDWIAHNGVDTLTVVGYMTHNCDASTIFEAAHLGLNVEFLSDASGSLSYENSAGRASAEEIHRVFSVVFQSRFAAVLGTDEWIAALASDAAPYLDNPYASNQRALARVKAAA